MAAIGHDVVCIGGSAGSTEPLLRVCEDLPAGFPGVVLVAVHQAAGVRSHLPELIARRARLRVDVAEDGAPLAPGRILLGPADFHLMAAGDRVRVVRGPRENGVRPAVDALFRTAALHHGPRAVGVLLSGTLDCGTRGLLSTHTRGGVTIVQHPEDAEWPAMPLNAIAAVPVDHIVAPPAIAPLLVALGDRPPRPEPPADTSTASKRCSPPRATRSSARSTRRAGLCRRAPPWPAGWPHARARAARSR